MRLGIGHQSEALSEPVNWNEVHALAERQGLAAVLVDGIEQLPNSQIKIYYFSGLVRCSKTMSTVMSYTDGL